MGGNPALIPPTGTGIWKKAPGLPHPHAERDFVGKIEGLIFDRFGDFEALRLETMNGEIKRFESREPHIAELAERAWQKRWRVLVVVDDDHPNRPTSIILLV
jgi:hypothetical protein